MWKSVKVLGIYICSFIFTRNDRSFRQKFSKGQIEQINWHPVFIANKLDMPELIEKRKLKHAAVYTVKDSPKIAIVEALSTYIPIDQFKETFHFIGELVAKEKITKLIFDKRKLSVFHQPSMEWYFVEWKEKMFELGLKTHRKILPKDEVFRQSVKIGREKINTNFPNGKFKLMDIAYSESLEQAIAE